ncbi:hypothetical protein SLEP1_g18615 [Rubroshorea leprosula]|uniref:Uncharacterized protein n=1 Tax=Rubroshorea leprosula TaxID=152421 RepID=A0AAV5IY24_9ROSI|nr:hypothetical protein SLEP1_g18615 [Rubroshorea leprosula]
MFPIITTDVPSKVSIWIFITCSADKRMDGNNQSAAKIADRSIFV